MFDEILKRCVPSSLSFSSLTNDSLQGISHRRWTFELQVARLRLHRSQRRAPWWSLGRPRPFDQQERHDGDVRRPSLAVSSLR